MRVELRHFYAVHRAHGRSVLNRDGADTVVRFTGRVARDCWVRAHPNRDAISSSSPAVRRIRSSGSNWFEDLRDTLRCPDEGFSKGGLCAPNLEKSLHDYRLLGETR